MVQLETANGKRRDAYVQFLNKSYTRPFFLALLLIVLPVVWNMPRKKAASSDLNERIDLPRESVRRVQTGPGPSLVSVNGRQLIVQKRNPNGTLAPAAAYTIRGVNWSPAGQNTNTSTGDPNNANVRRPEFGIWAATDIPLMRNMNVNTVRMFMDPGIDANGKAVLDQLYSDGIMVIMTVDDAVNNTVRVQQAVNFYKDHPAVLMWMLGNEWNINNYYGVANSALDAAQRTQTAAALVKSLDSNHPVATSYGEIDINGGLPVTQSFVNQICPAVDIWGLNIYRGNTFGSLFEQWRAISSKPMFIGESGTDAFRSFNPNPSPPGIVDEVSQSQWVLSLWNHLFKNLSALNPSNTAIGGCVFEFSDEWWKVQPFGSQQTGGFLSLNGHPDSFANEEYFGIMDINRQPRLLYQILTTVFVPNYQPPHSITYRAMSRGSTAHEFPFQNGVCRFFKDGVQFHQVTGGAGGGRGFNVAVINPCTGELKQPIQNFDTWSTRNTGAAMIALTKVLNSVSNGEMVLLAVADEAGLNQFPPNDCVSLGHPWIEPFYQAIESLGGTRIRQYCYWNSWAMSAIKGNPQTAQEQLANANEANASLDLPIQTTISPTSRFFTRSAGSSAVTVTSSSNCNWTAVSNNTEWLNIISGNSGNGNGTVTYSFAATSNQNPRFGTITIGGQVHTVTQSSVKTPFDYDADGRADLSVRRPSDDNWYVLRGTAGYMVMTFGLPGDLMVPADYDGDAKTDIAMFRPSTGQWFIFNSQSQTFVNYSWGAAGDLPVPADHDGDGKADLVVFRQSDGTWYRRLSNNTFSNVAFGVAGDKPVVGDFDGDGKFDIALYRPSDHNWYILKTGFGFFVQTWGEGADIPVPTDYDGDGSTDVSVWRPSTGQWFRIQSTAGFGVLNWGQTGDMPIPADYDGDGKADVAVFRPSTGTWFAIGSTNGIIQQQFGQNGDLPTQSAFIY